MLFTIITYFNFIKEFTIYAYIFKHILCNLIVSLQN